MRAAELLIRRLRQHGLAAATFDRPEDVVSWFGAVQAQDYLGALWALGLRMRTASESLVEDAVARRAIIRTWPMRGTLHFVAAADVRWITQLLAPRVIARHSARWEREFGVTPQLVERAFEALAQALQHGKRLERGELYAALEARRIRTGNSRGLHILLWLSMQGRLCLAGRRGKQQTYALLDDWVPRSRRLEGEAALAELARRYFTSHGPATLKDFVWWSGLTVRDAKVAIEVAKPQLSHEMAADVSRWSGAEESLARPARQPIVRLLPAYDEYTVGYQDRGALLPSRKHMPAIALLAPVVVVDGQVAGTWKRSLARGNAQIDIKPLRKLTPSETTALDGQIRRYQAFLQARS